MKFRLIKEDVFDSLSKEDREDYRRYIYEYNRTGDKEWLKPITYFENGKENPRERVNLALLKKVQRVRESLDVSQWELMGMIGVYRQKLADIENGYTRSLSDEFLEEILEKLKEIRNGKVVQA